jgi:hypothetical protein
MRVNAVKSIWNPRWTLPSPPPPPPKRGNENFKFSGAECFLSRRMEVSPGAYKYFKDVLKRISRIQIQIHWIRVLYSEWANFLLIFQAKHTHVQNTLLTQTKLHPYWGLPNIYGSNLPLLLPTPCLRYVQGRGPPLGQSRIPQHHFWVTPIPRLHYLNTSLFLNFPTVACLAFFFLQFSDHPC